jgi:hypothetical protein
MASLMMSPVEVFTSATCALFVTLAGEVPPSGNCCCVLAREPFASAALASRFKVSMDFVQFRLLCRYQFWSFKYRL